VAGYPTEVIWYENATPCLPEAFPLVILGTLLTVIGRFAVPVSTELVAERPTVETPNEVGVPEIIPVAVLIERPVGKEEAPNDVGDFVAVIVYGVIAVPEVNTSGVKELVITGRC
jgi:hypothetical protein